MGLGGGKGWRSRHGGQDILAFTFLILGWIWELGFQGREGYVQYIHFNIQYEFLYKLAHCGSQLVFAH